MNGAALAVVLLSGGLDSTTLLAYALAEGFIVHAMTFRYGQRHAVEIDAARRVAARLGVREHIVVDIDLRTFGGSALTSDAAVPKDRPLDEMRHGIPITYVPARNTIFLSYALAWSEVLGSSDIFIGVKLMEHRAGEEALHLCRRQNGDLGCTLRASISRSHRPSRQG